MQANIAQEMAAVADVETKQIANWRAERLGDGRLIIGSAVAEAAARIIAGAPRPGDALLLENGAKRLARTFTYSGGELLDLKGNLCFFGPNRMNPDYARSLVHEAILRGDAVLSDLTPEPDAAHPMMHLAVPVNAVGALVLNIDPQRFLYPYLASWPGSSSTAESFLVRREGSALIYLSPRHDLAGAQVFSRRAVEAGRPSNGQLEAGWDGSRNDYRGIYALGTVRHIPDSPWNLACKIDYAEAIQPIKRLELEMTLILALIALAAASVGAVITRNGRNALLQKREAWFRAVSNDTPAFLWMASPEDDNSFLNNPLARFVGIDRPQRSGYWQVCIHPDDKDRVVAAFHQARKVRGEFKAIYRLRRFDGEFRWMCDRGVPRFSASGKFLGYAGALEDVTERYAAERQLRDVNAALADELAERMRAEQEVHRLSARLIDAQEEERKRLARELHDDLTQQIAALTIAMSNLRRTLPHGIDAALAQSSRIFDSLVRLSEKVRRVSHQLHPAVLQYSGLAAALREYCGEFEALTGIRVMLRVEGAFDAVTPAQELTLYRIAQEALQNVAKHARTTVAEVELISAEGGLRLTVCDRGVGIDPNVRAESAGLGLVSMKERARLAGGSLRFEPGPHGGAIVSVEIPVEAPNASLILTGFVH